MRKVIEFNEQKLEAKREQTEESVRQRGVDITTQLGGLADDIKGRVPGLSTHWYEAVSEFGPVRGTLIKHIIKSRQRLPEKSQLIFSVCLRYEVLWIKLLSQLQLWMRKKLCWACQRQPTRTCWTIFKIFNHLCCYGERRTVLLISPRHGWTDRSGFLIQRLWPKRLKLCGERSINLSRHSMIILNQEKVILWFISGQLPVLKFSFSGWNNEEKDW